MKFKLTPHGCKDLPMRTSKGWGGDWGLAVHGKLQ